MSPNWTMLHFLALWFRCAHCNLHTFCWVPGASFQCTTLLDLGVLHRPPTMGHNGIGHQRIQLKRLQSSVQSSAKHCKPPSMCWPIDKFSRPRLFSERTILHKQQLDSCFCCCIGWMDCASKSRSLLCSSKNETPNPVSRAILGGDD